MAFTAGLFITLLYITVGSAHLFANGIDHGIIQAVRVGSSRNCDDGGVPVYKPKSDCGSVVAHQPAVYQLAPVMVAPVVKTLPQFDLTKNLEDMTAKWLKMKADLTSKMLENLKSFKSSLKTRSHQQTPVVFLPISVVPQPYQPKAVKPCCPRQYPVYTKPTTNNYIVYTKPSTKSYPVYTQHTTRSYPIYTKPTTTSYPVYTKPTPPKPAPTARCCINVPISDLETKYQKPSYPSAPEYMTDMYQSGSSLKIIPGVNVTATLRGLEITHSNYSKLVNSSNLLDCLTRSLCEATCDVKKYGNHGQDLIKSLGNAQISRVTGLKASVFRDASSFGITYRSSCHRCAEQYPKCKASLEDILKISPKPL